MATKTINLTEGAYARLASLKREGESFSQVVDRLTGKFGLLDLIGILDDRSARELRSVKKDLGKRLRKGMDRSSGR
jgi:predicted CopG family antitoxin